MASRSCFSSRVFSVLCILGVLFPVLASAQDAPEEIARRSFLGDSLKAGRFDYGKMWTFDDPPAAFFSDTYGFDANEAWFERARLATLRVPGCTASFISRDGLVATNHHCARGSISAVARQGEDLLSNGFYASSLEAERKIPGYYADQLVKIEDVTARIQQAVDAAATPEARAAARAAAVRGLQADLLRPLQASPDSFVVQIVSLYNGGRYAAYTFCRYTDLRLVFAPEDQLGFFGGDYDNFTFPRYDLDFAFYRAYGADGKPIQTPHFFTPSRAGVSEGDAVFVVGNPGSTTRLETVAQLEYRRDVLNGATIAYLHDRIERLERFMKEHPEEAAAFDLRNTLFSLGNQLKAFGGRQDALSDPGFIVRKQDAERQFVERLAARGDAAPTRLFDELAALQQEKRALAVPVRAFTGLTSSNTTASTLVRALLAQQLLDSRAAGAPAARLEELTKTVLGLRNFPAALERTLLEARLADIAAAYGADHPMVRSALGGRTPSEAADAILGSAAYRDSAGVARVLAAGATPAGDPAAAFAAAVLPVYNEYTAQSSRLQSREQDLAAQLGRARFEVYGTSVPPDATFSLRIADGRVQGYDYNGTRAPVYTTFYGLLDRYYSFGKGTAWDLPPRWLSLPAAFDRATPLNFITTSDTIGGNSGSPIVNQRLEFVGINFDRNVEGLSRDYMYLPARGRNMGVDVRAMRETLDDVYDADRLVREMNTGRLVATEQEADRSR